MKEMKPIPEIGKYYHFWDDGKSSPSRHYICRVEKIITPQEAKGILVTIPSWDFESNTEVFDKCTLYDNWKNEVTTFYWLYAEDTDYFIEISCPHYDDNNLYAVRTKDGGWFTMDVQSSWQSGRLDIDDSIYEYNTKYYKEYTNCSDEYVLESYHEATEENWKL